MPHRSPVSFLEISKQLFEKWDAPGRTTYVNSTQKKVITGLRKVIEIREHLTEIQDLCAHDNEWWNLADRKVHQCSQCGLIRVRPKAHG